MLERSRVGARWIILSLLVALAGCTGASVDPGGGGGDAGAGAGAESDAGGDAGTADAGVTPQWVLPVTGLRADQVGVLVNSQDPQSVAVAAAYVEKRGIPQDHVYTLSFPVTQVMSVPDYTAARALLDSKLDGGSPIEAFVITWTTPYRVDCMSATTAFAITYDTKFCNTTSNACGTTAPTNLYDNETHTPWEDTGVRPTLMLAASSAQEAIQLIDHGVAGDDTFPAGTVYLVRTTDAVRSNRYPDFIATAAMFADGGLDVRYVDGTASGASSTITDTAGVFGYQTGFSSVAGIETNTYLPGAFADHLTSYGGQVPVGGQMSIAAWLAAGATGSCGTVVEPCNFQTKFVRASVFWPRYFRGETLAEALWKSVQWPGEANFAGDPLARPFGRQDASYEPGSQTLTLRTNWVEPGKTYAIDGADSPDGPWTEVESGLSFATRSRQMITVQPAVKAYYRIVERP